MAAHNTLEVCRRDLFTAEHELRQRYPDITVKRVMRIRDAYNFMLANPESKEREVVDHIMARAKDVSRSAAYADLGLLKQLLPLISQNSRDFHRWRYQEMIMETYRMAKRRKDTKTMERCATSYAKYTRIDIEEDAAMDYDKIIVQPFVPTLDVSVLNIKPIPNVYDRIDKLTKELARDMPEIMDVEAEEADLQEDVVFQKDNKEADLQEDVVFQKDNKEDTPDGESDIL